VFFFIFSEEALASLTVFFLFLFPIASLRVAELLRYGAVTVSSGVARYMQSQAVPILTVFPSRC